MTFGGSRAATRPHPVTQTLEPRPERNSQDRAHKDSSFRPLCNVTLVPLGTSLLAGPGAIVTAIVYVRRIDTLPDLVALAAGLVAVHVAVWFSGLIIRSSQIAASSWSPAFPACYFSHRGSARR